MSNGTHQETNGLKYEHTESSDLKSLSLSRLPQLPSSVDEEEKTSDIRDSEDESNGIKGNKEKKNGIDEEENTNGIRDSEDESNGIKETQDKKSGIEDAQISIELLPSSLPAVQGGGETEQRGFQEEIEELKAAKASLEATCDALQRQLKAQEQKLEEALAGVQNRVDLAMQDAMLACHKHVEAILEMKLQKESGFSDGLFWHAMSHGSILPPNAVPARGGFYIGRARHQAHIIPGRVDPGAGTCYITFGGREHRYREYEILVNRGGLVNLAWRPGMNGSVPPAAVVGGRQANYPAPLFVGRMRGSGRPGKLAAYGNNCLFVGDGNGREIEADQYEVLTVVTQGGAQAVVL
eukprot:TRINITY_DN775_c0_g1_i1.p1 TRINITY_DN775_c0_g1~~TRINITY_DN775_c0_g1_i1.p1  ORF type:complete len:392 (+),score=87.46 TRINITY_DN775_c0_g1_i1:125-1177(+)